MLIFRPSKQPISRNYDHSQIGMAPININQKDDDQTPNNHQIDNDILINNFITIFSSIFLSSIGYGILMVLIALQVEANIKNELLISFSTTSQIISGVIFARFLPNIVAKFGAIKSIYIFSTITAILSLLLYQYYSYLVWLLLIFILGITFFACGVIRQTLMIDISPIKTRAMVISCGTMIVAVGNSLGPIIFNFLQTLDYFIIHFIACCFYIASIFPLFRAKIRNFDKNKINSDKKITIFNYIKNSPKIMFSGFTASYCLSSTNAFLIIYGIKIGLNDSDAAMLLSTLLFGTIFSIPLAYLADLFNRRLVIIFFAFLSLVTSYNLMLNNDFAEMKLSLFLLFGFIAGVKLPAIVLINEKYKSTQRLAVNSAFAKFSLIGNICGILSTGLAMKLFGPQGLWLSIITILTLFIIFYLLNYYHKIYHQKFSFSWSQILQNQYDREIEQKLQQDSNQNQN